MAKQTKAIAARKMPYAVNHHVTIRDGRAMSQKYTNRIMAPFLKGGG